MSYTQMLQQNEWERDEKECTELRGSPLIKATSTGGKTESLYYYWCNTQVEAYSKYRASLPYINRGQNKKK